MKAITRMALGEGVVITGLLIGGSFVHYFVSIWGLSDYLEEGAFKAYVTGPYAIWGMIIWSLTAGILLSLANFVTQTPSLRRLPLGQIILLRSVLSVICLILAGLTVQLGLAIIVSPEQAQFIVTGLSDRYYDSIYVWVGFITLLISLLIEVRRKIGPGNLLALFTGRYQRPRLESRVFLFLDLQQSTTIAEKLGHEKYSAFLRSCFGDLTETILEYGAEVYQYVGDEVILTWRGDGARPARMSLSAFFSFEEKLRSRKVWYTAQYGNVPVFRGGVEMGQVTATEVGEVKREIAYHGDVLNTSARLLELTKQYEENLMVSGRVWRIASDDSEFRANRHGELTLRGKTAKVDVYGIRGLAPAEEFSLGATET